MDLIEQLRLNICQTYLGLGKQSPQAKIRIDETMWLCESPIEHPIGNFACHLDAAPSDLEDLALLAKSRPCFRIYAIGGDKPNDIPETLTALGLTERYRLAGMFSEECPTGAGQDFEHAASVRDVSAIAHFMVDTFFWRSKREDRKTLAAILAASAGDGQQFYWLRKKALVVAALSLCQSEGVLGIYNLCVRVEERGRGIGASAVRQMAKQAYEAGLVPFLQCDPSLAGWYERLGFRQGTQLAAFSS